MTLCALGPVVFGYSGDGGPPALEDLVKNGSARFADMDVFANAPVSQFMGPGLAEVTLNLHFWEPYTWPLATSMILLNFIKDNGFPMPLFAGNQLMGNGISLFTVRNISEHWQIIPSRVTKAKVQVTLKEYATPLSANALVNLVGQALSLI